MICPTCGTHVPDDATICPACHAQLHAHHASGAQREDVFCKNCGALVPPGRISCPSCGFPLDDELVESVIEHEAGEAKPKASARRPKAAQIESVIPAKPSDGYRSAAPKEHFPHYKVVITAAVCALLAVGGTVLLITQPWNPNINVRHATTDADTSMAGYPGEISKLSGQDKSQSESGSEGSDPYYDELSSFYTTLGDISSKADDNEKTLRSVVSGGGDDAAKGADEAKQLSLDLSNAITEFSNHDFSSSPYEDQGKALETLASYLRNRLDVLSSAWSAATSASAPADASAKVTSLLDDTASGSSSATWKQLFSQNYESAKPQEQSGDSSSDTSLDASANSGSDDSSNSSSDASSSGGSGSN